MAGGTFQTNSAIEGGRDRGGEERRGMTKTEVEPEEEEDA